MPQAMGREVPGQADPPKDPAEDAVESGKEGVGRERGGLGQDKVTLHHQCNQLTQRDNSQGTDPAQLCWVDVGVGPLVSAGEQRGQRGRRAAADAPPDVSERPVPGRGPEGALMSSRRRVGVSVESSREDHP